MAKWVLPETSDFLTTNAAEALNRTIHRYLKKQRPRTDVLTVKMFQFHQHFYVEVMRGRYDDGNYHLRPDQREFFNRKTDIIPPYPKVKSVEEIFNDVKENRRPSILQVGELTLRILLLCVQRYH